MSVAAPSPPIETFPALRTLPCRQGFVGRIPGVDVNTDRAAALTRLDEFHRRARHALTPDTTAFITAEQVHGNTLAVLTPDDPLPAAAFPGVDGPHHQPPGRDAGHLRG